MWLCQPGAVYIYSMEQYGLILETFGAYIMIINAHNYISCTINIYIYIYIYI